MRLGNLHRLIVCSSVIAAFACGDDPPVESNSGGDTDSSTSADSGSRDASADSDASADADADASAEGGSTGGNDTTDDASTTGDGASTDTTADDGSTGDASTTGEDGSTGSDEETTGGEEPDLCTCAENTDLIYVLSDNAQLWSFDPETLQFAQITASLGCPSNSTFSMSVDRNGVAYVMFQNDAIHTVDVNNPNMCVNPGYVPGQLNFNKFGMGFVSNSALDPCDKLYAHSWSGIGGFGEGPNSGRLGRMDTSDLVMEELGFIDYDGGELTGTGDGRLFAFAGAPAKLVEYDKDTATVLATEQLAMSLTNAFAFAFFGGDFFMFTESDGNASVSKVTHYDYDDDKSLSVVVAQAPIRIVGAGVSTCAPVLQ